MATTSSSLFNALDAAASAPDASVLGGRVRCAVALFDDIAAGSTGNGDILKIAPLPSNARVISIQMSNTDHDSGDNDTTYDLGLYDQDGNDLDSDVYIDGGTELRAAANRTELLDPVDLDGDFGKRVWEQADLTADPNSFIDLCLTIKSATAESAIDCAFVILYVVD